jgi:hypothetical protein
MKSDELAKSFRAAAVAIRGAGKRAALNKWGVLIVGQTQRNQTDVFKTHSAGGMRKVTHHSVIGNSQLRIRIPKPYARIHEFGGTTKPHVIEPRNAKALRFIIGGRVVFARRVHHPGSRITEKRFTRNAIETTLPQGIALLHDVIRRPIVFTGGLL